MSTTTEQPAGPAPHTPGAGLRMLQERFPGRYPDLTDEDRRHGDEIRAEARAMIEGRAA